MRSFRDTPIQRKLIAISLIFLSLFLFVPLIAVFFEAFKKGVDVYLAAIVEPDAVSAIKLTLIAAGISVPGTPLLTVLNRPSSVRPETQTCVRSGARTPRASMP